MFCHVKFACIRLEVFCMGSLYLSDWNDSVCEVCIYKIGNVLYVQFVCITLEMFSLCEVCMYKIGSVLHVKFA